MICRLNTFRNASKLADAQTELAFLNNADISKPSTTTDICKGSRMGYPSRFLCFQDRNFSPVLLYLSLGVAGAEPARNRTGRRESRGRGKNVGRRPRERGSCYILKRWRRKFERRGSSLEQETSVNRAGEYGTGNIYRGCRNS